MARAAAGRADSMCGTPVRLGQQRGLGDRAVIHTTSMPVAGGGHGADKKAHHRSTVTNSATTSTSLASSFVSTMGSQSGLVGDSVTLACFQPPPVALVLAER